MKEGNEYIVDIGICENIKIICLKIKDDKIKILDTLNNNKNWFGKSEIKLVKQLTFK